MEFVQIIRAVSKEKHEFVLISLQLINCHFALKVARDIYPDVTNRTNPNEKSIELNRTPFVRLFFDWFGNRT